MAHVCQEGALCPVGGFGCVARFSQFLGALVYNEFKVVAMLFELGFGELLRSNIFGDTESADDIAVFVA